MLEAAIVLQTALGEYVEAAIIFGLLIFNAALGFFQEGRAQATLAALKSRLALTATVRRNGVWSTLPAAELVPGDIVKLSLGGVVAADVRLVEGSVLLDQSMLTGESMPIEAGPNFQTYAGAMVRRGEAVAEVTATGTRTKFGRTAELVLSAHVVSSQQKAVLRVVRNLAMFNGTLIVILVAYAWFHGMPLDEIVSLVLTAILASIPVALPATFTLAAAVGARSLARQGVLPTRLSAVDEAASIDVLCSDKTGTLTRNELTVTAVRPLPGFDEAHVLGLAALAGSDGGQDPVDAAIRSAAARNSSSDLPKRKSVRAVRSGDEDVRGDSGGFERRQSAHRERGLCRSSAVSRNRRRRPRRPQTNWNRKASEFWPSPSGRRRRCSLSDSSHSATRLGRTRQRSSRSYARWACVP